MTKLGKSRRISPPQRKLFVTVLIGILVLGALIGLYYSPVGKALFGLAVAVPQSEVYYSFDSGGANSGTLRNIRSATIPREVNCADVGVLGNGCEFPGTAEGFVTLPAEILNGKTDFSVSFWMRTERNSPNEGVVLSGSNAGQLQELKIRISSFRNDIFIIWEKGDWWAISSDVINIRDGQWHHVGITIVPAANGNNVFTIYVDGNFITNFGLPGGALDINTLTVGKMSAGAAPIPFTGQLDELRFYHRPLTAGEVTDLYNEGIVHCGEQITKSRSLVTERGGDVLDCHAQDVDAIEIAANGVDARTPLVFDCNGQAIQVHPRKKGVVVRNRQNVKIQNCQIEKANVGIAVDNSQHVTVTGNTVVESNDFAIHLTQANSNNVSLNTINKPGAVGANKQGIFVINSNGNEIRQNTIEDVDFNGITLINSPNNLRIEENTLVRNNFGIHLTFSTGNILKKNTIVEQRTQGITLISGSNGNTLQENQIDNSGTDGIFVTQSNSNQLIENRIHRSNGAGIVVTSAVGSVLQRNVVNQNPIGLSFDAAGLGTIVEGNNVCDNNAQDVVCQASTITGKNNILGEFDQADKVAACADWPIHRANPVETDYSFCFLLADDQDADGVADEFDNCLNIGNVDQANLDNDVLGDACDLDKDGDAVDNDQEVPIGLGTDPLDPDTDNDGICDGDAEVAGVCVRGSADNCPLIDNSVVGPGGKKVNGPDTDGDGLGDACDLDDDGDGIPDDGDNSGSMDDNICLPTPVNNRCDDNCRIDSNRFQENLDGDSFGDACDGDNDNDSLLNEVDNCPRGNGNNLYEDVDRTTTSQTDADRDGQGDFCDPDDDNDAVFDNVPDNCPLVQNSVDPDGPGINQPVNGLDSDNDGLGDACDADDDGDGIPDGRDNCPLAANPNQENSDRPADNLGDVCDNDPDSDGVGDLNGNELIEEGGQIDFCPLVPDETNADTDGDERGNICDNCVGVPNPNQVDTDDDTIGDACDSCPGIPDFFSDLDEDEIDDACDPDRDGDGLLNAADASPDNPDSDGDDVPDGVDNCPVNANAPADCDTNPATPEAQCDLDTDRIGDVCDLDKDGDTVPDRTDNCSLVANGPQQDNQANGDGDRFGDVCDPDRDGDGVPNEADIFPDNREEQLDTDSDGVGDRGDNCPNAHNPDQENRDADRYGDVCQGNVDQPCNADGTCNQGIFTCSDVDHICRQDADGDRVSDMLEPAACQHTEAGREVYRTTGCLIGDVNGDGCANLVDIARLSQSLRERFTPTLQCAGRDPTVTEQHGDLNHDGCVNLRDIALLSAALQQTFNADCRP